MDARTDDPGPGAGRRNRPRKTPKGRQVEPTALDEVRALLGDRERRRDLLIEYLHLIQDSYGYLSAAHLAALAQEMKLALTEVYEVATFYAHFDVVKEGETPPPAVTVRVCDSLSCAMAGAERLMRDLPHKFGSDVRIVRAPCMGACDRAPVCAVGHAQVMHATTESVATAVAHGAHAHVYPTPNDFDRYVHDGGYTLLRACLAGTRTREDIIKAVSDAGLRGLGGAGFPTGRKWTLVRAEPAPRLMAVNADEGEPGTFKDRYYLERDPHRFIEGMLIAAWVIEAPEIYLYIRDEYPEVRLMLERRARQGRRGRALPARPDSSAPRCRSLYLRRRIRDDRIDRRQTWPAKASAALRRPGRSVRPADARAERRDAVLGARHRGERRRLVHVARTPRAQGVPQFFGLGPGAQTRRGARARRGHRPRADRGILRRHDRGPQLQGLSARRRLRRDLPAAMADLPLDFGMLEKYGCFVGSHAVVILSDKDDMKAVALNLMRFFEDESCGQCTPCRVGTEKAVKLMATGPWDEALLNELSDAMRDASICGLGQAAPNPLLSVLKYFPEDLKTPLGSW